ncbi:transposase [Methylocella silvestris]|uniref:transposase n=1 Tax=Methylocella silvestris TaxID=199596 RepID=UPI0015E08BBD
MKASKFTEVQIAFILKQAENGAAVAEVCRKAGISDATFYNWRKAYAGLTPSEMKRLRQLEEENAKLKRIVADLSLDMAMDFVHDQLATGRKFRVFTIVDTFSRFSPAVDPRFSYRGEDVVLTLEQICRSVGYPKTIRVDQGSEFVSRDLDGALHEIKSQCFA